jgi:hypothetical protein
MNFRTTVILFGLVIVGLGVFALMQFLNVQTPEEREEAARWLVPTFNDKFKPVRAADVTKVVLERQQDGKAEKLAFEKGAGGQWQMVAPRKARTDANAVNRLVDQLINAERDKYADLSSRLAEYGLEQPKTTVTLTYKAPPEKKKDDKAKDQAKDQDRPAVEKTLTVSFGDQSPDKKDPVVYALSSDNPKAPTAVPRARVDKVFAPVEDFRAKELLGSAFDVTGLRVAGADRKPLALEKVDNRDWRFAEPKLGDADAAAADNLARDLGNIKVEKNSDYVADGPFDAAKLASYGLTDEKATYKVSVTRKDAADPKKTVTETLLVGAKDPQAVARAAAVRAAALAGELLTARAPAGGLAPAVAGYQARAKQDEDAGAYYAKLADDDTVVRIEAKALKALEKKPDDLRAKTVVKIDPTKVDAINVTAAGETLRLRRPNLKVEGSATAATSEWDLFTDSRAKTRTHLDTVTKLIDALNKVEVAGPQAFLDDDAKQRAWFGTEPIDLGLDKPQAEIAVWQEAIKRDKDGKPEGDGEPKLKDDVKAKPLARITVGRKDDKRNVVYVRRQVGDHLPAILAVPDPWTASAAPPPSPFGQPPPPPSRDQVSLSKLVAGGYYAFRDRRLDSFVSSNVTALKVDRPAAAYDLVREEKKSDTGLTTTSWLLKKPVEGKADGNTVSFFLNTLAGLSADRLVTDRPTERDLKEKFGLADKPTLRAVVTETVERDGKKVVNELTYTVGRRTESDGANADHYYARVEAKPASGPAPEGNQFVFLVPLSTLQALDVELRDPTVFAEERTAQPVEATLVWRKLDKDKKLQETKLELAAQPAGEGSAQKTWAVKALTVNGQDAKAGLPKLDVAKVQRLLGTGGTERPFGQAGPSVNPLSTERFVVHHGKPEPKHQLDPASKDAPPALVLSVKYDNNTTRTLTLGARFEAAEAEYPGLAPRAFYYAAASTLPEAVFVVNETLFKDLAAGPDFFKPAAEKVSQVAPAAAVARAL